MECKVKNVCILFPIDFCNAFVRNVGERLRKKVLHYNKAQSKGRNGRGREFDAMSTAVTFVTKLFFTMWKLKGTQVDTKFGLLR